MVAFHHGRMIEQGEALHRFTIYDPFQGAAEGRYEVQNTATHMTEQLFRTTESFINRLGHSFQATLTHAERHVWLDGMLHMKFAIRNRKQTASGCGKLDFMVFASPRLNFLNEAKRAMMKVRANEDDLGFSYFHRNIPEYVRKIDDWYEAQIIWEKLGLRGRTLPLGQVRKYILLKSPLLFNAKALQVLEITMRIMHVKTVPLTPRVFGDFCTAATPCTIHVADNAQATYGNYWSIVFSSNPNQESVCRFVAKLTNLALLANQGDNKENLQQFINWLRGKMACLSEQFSEISMRRLQTSLPHRIIDDTTLYTILRGMIKMQAVREIDPEVHTKVSEKRFQYIGRPFVHRVNPW